MTQQLDFLRLARQLGVRVESPFVVHHEGSVVQFDAYLPDFGGRNGMVLLIDGMFDFEELSPVVNAAGFYFSALNGSAPTSEGSVKETLEDWGFFGAEDVRPAWFTGKSWS